MFRITIEKIIVNQEEQDKYNRMSYEELYKQRVEELDLWTVIEAINNPNYKQYEV